jgi:hypothetical protein
VVIDKPFILTGIFLLVIEKLFGSSRKIFMVRVISGGFLEIVINDIAIGKLALLNIM